MKATHTKFLIDDTVYFMKNNTIHHGKIENILLTKANQRNSSEVSYQSNEINYSDSFFHDTLFSTKQNLLDSL